MMLSRISRTGLRTARCVRPSVGRISACISRPFSALGRSSLVGLGSVAATRPISISAAQSLRLMPHRALSSAAPNSIETVEMTTDNAQSIISRSMQSIVIVDCHADWCQPCRDLEPRLQAAVRKITGKVVFAKLDTEKYPQIAQSFQVQNLPTVFGLYKGRIVDAFMGNAPDDQLSAFIGKLNAAVGGPATKQPEEGGGQQDVAQWLKMAEGALKKGDTKSAAQVYATVLGTEDNKAHFPVALAGLAQCVLAENDLEQAKSLIQKLTTEYKNSLSDPFVAQAITAVQLAEEVLALGDAREEDLLKALEADPNNHENRYKLTVLYFSKGQHEKALDEGFKIIRKDRNWNEGATRKLFVKIFDALGSANPVAKKGRARLSNYLNI